ncbi:MAG: NAD-dependent epimerase/dehydratase family protein [Acidobacteria bacterium]|nr:MAG: NAD-dependent epimerase/dehydratase family protein [Acidobacteriota bacterium]REK04408.1 MAG: NAD-dependent epimerase/dehydratase family protein [Acidobacteriota bacterium]
MAEQGVFQDKAVVVTGGTGSLGQALVRRILTGEEGRPHKVIVLSRDEAKQHEMRNWYLNLRSSTDEVLYHNFANTLELRIGDVRCFDDVCSVLRGAEIVLHAAALKQVPTCEYFPSQAVATNCLGAENIVRAIRDHGYPVETVVGVSTDKACKPVNVMGMTKAIQERIFIAANVLVPETRFTCVRYGNVLSSRGSVVPLFESQIEAGGPVTITDPRMTRFLLTLEEAVDVVFESIRASRRGETLVPIVRSARVLDIARAMLDGRDDIELVEVGTRPGEKVHEILVSEEECRHVERRGAHYVILPLVPELRDATRLDPVLEQEYSSADSPLSFEDTLRLLRENGLVPDPGPSRGGLAGSASEQPSGRLSS